MIINTVYFETHKKAQNTLWGTNESFLMLKLVVLKD
jgi:hypothetical protein